MSVEQLQIIASTDGELAGLAQQALEIQAMAYRGEISESEMSELLVDLARSQAVEEAAGDLETKTSLVTAIFVVEQVV